jgi:divalent metal cation (Fe/Co/Zn/Cd) transporter
LVADAKHSWLDALSSAGALAGLALVAAGYRWGDPIAGFAVTLFIVHVGWEVTGELVHHLMDGVDEEHVNAAATAAAGVPGVRDVAVRARWTGRSLILEITGTLGPAVALRDADRIGDAVREAVFDAVEEARVVQWIARAE